MQRLISGRRRLFLATGDLFAIFLANLLAVALRFDFDWAAIATRRYRNIELLCLDLLLTPIVFYAVGMYQSYWKYAGLDDLLRLTRAIAYRTVLLIVIFYTLGFAGLSRAVMIIATVLLLVLAGAVRIAPRFSAEFFSARQRSGGRRTLIVGAGDTGELLLRELRKAPQTEYNPIGFVDDDPEKVGVKIHGVPVLGTRQKMGDLLEEYNVQELIIAVPNATSAQVRELFDLGRRAGARVRTVPTRGELDRGAARIGQIRLVELEDLLGRDVVQLDQHLLNQKLAGTRVLVTGAAGSIGREIARQVAARGPRELVLVDRNENSMFYLDAELRDAYPHVQIRPIIGDILDEGRMESLFSQSRPSVVLHAAAYKHVPLMEANPCEAVKNNVLGTMRLSQLAVRHGAERFIYISTDKAVRPTSVMGATKRLGERMVKSLKGGATRFMTVRFGNVLGSDGSVVPTFRKQIAAGGPVTVTHPEATRFFMTIPEAVQLVLTAGAMGQGGETFLLQMGQPVLIADLARNLIELSGFRPGEDIKIAFTGLRPGEKLHEELQNEGENALPTSNEKIMSLTGVEPLGTDEWATVDALARAAGREQHEICLELLRSLIPDFVPSANDQQRPASRDAKVVEIAGKRRLDAKG